MNFDTLPVRVVLLNTLVWPNHGIVPKELVTPRYIRPIDAEPIHIEQLLDGTWFVHDGRHRALRAQARGDIVIVARGLSVQEKCAPAFRRLVIKTSQEAAAA